MATRNLPLGNAPVLVSIMVAVFPRRPATASPKLKLIGVMVRSSRPVTPVPFNPSDAVADPGEPAMIALVLSPTVVGAKIAVTMHDPPGGSVAGQAALNENGLSFESSRSPNMGRSAPPALVTFACCGPLWTPVGT